jgi:hypothetical protein
LAWSLEEERKYRILWRKHLGKRTIIRQELNGWIKMYLREIGSEDGRWVRLGQNQVQYTIDVILRSLESAVSADCYFSTQVGAYYITYRQGQGSLNCRDTTVNFVLVHFCTNNYRVRE